MYWTRVDDRLLHGLWLSERLDDLGRPDAQPWPVIGAARSRRYRSSLLPGALMWRT